MMDFDMQRCERIIWPEILLRGLEYWLVQATSSKNKETPSRFKLPAIFASSDNRTWLATRKSQRLHKEALYAEWLSSSTPDQAKTSPEMNNARVPCLTQHTFTTQHKNLAEEPMTEEVKDYAGENKEKSAKENNTRSLKENNSSSPSYNDIWLRSNSCTSAVHENSNFRFMYSDSTSNNENNKWLAQKSCNKEQKWSPKRMKLEPVSNDILTWTSTGSARLFDSSVDTKIVSLASTMETKEEFSTSNMNKSLWLSTDSSVSFKAAENLMDITPAKEDLGLDENDMSSWLKADNTESANLLEECTKEESCFDARDKSSWLKAENANSLMNNTSSDKHMDCSISKNNNILSSWLNVKTTTSTPVNKLIMVNNTNSQKHQDIIGWINNVKQEEVKVNDTHEENMLEEKSANGDIDSWLMKSTDSRIDPVDAVRTGFKTLQVADCGTTSTKCSPSASFAPVTFNLGPSSDEKQVPLVKEPSHIALTANLTTNKTTLLSEWLSAGTLKNHQVSTNQPITAPFAGSLFDVTRNRFSEAGKSLSSDTEHSSLSWVLCSESENASSRASSCDDVIMM